MDSVEFYSALLIFLELELISYLAFQVLNKKKKKKWTSKNTLNAIIPKTILKVLFIDSSLK